MKLHVYFYKLEHIVILPSLMKSLSFAAYCELSYSCAQLRRICVEKQTGSTLLPVIMPSKTMATTQGQVLDRRHCFVHLNLTNMSSLIRNFQLSEIICDPTF